MILKTVKYKLESENPEEILEEIKRIYPEDNFNMTMVKEEGYVSYRVYRNQSVYSFTTIHQYTGNNGFWFCKWSKYEPYS